MAVPLVNLSHSHTYMHMHIHTHTHIHIQTASMCPQPRSPSPDDFDEPPQPNMMSPMSPMFKPIQDCITHLQVPRRNITISNMLGEGAFGEVSVFGEKVIAHYCICTKNETLTPLHVATLTVQRELPKYES